MKSKYSVKKAGDRKEPGVVAKLILKTIMAGK